MTTGSDRGEIRGEPSPGREGAVLEIRGARRSYEGRRALTGVDLRVCAGEIYGLLGPNGAGKTSLVRAASGRLRLERGSVRVCGQDPASSRSARRRLGLVPQEIALWPELTARENLVTFARLMGMASNEAAGAATHLLERVRLEDRSDDRVRELSGGMKRRLNIAAGVIHAPDVLLLDEPTVGVDPAAKESIHAMLRELRRDGLAILLTTHDLEQASELCDRVGILVDGVILREGGVRSLIGEVFGDGKELIVTLRHEPPSDARRSLEGMRFEPSQDPRTWISAAAETIGDWSTVAAGLEDAGLVVAEARIREPSLRGVYFRLAGREIDA